MLKLKIPPPLYLFIFIMGIWWANQAIPIYSLIPENIKPIGLGLIILFICLDLWSVLLFFKQKTTINPLAPKNSQHLVTSGMYQISRNPMYLGLAFILFGWCIYLGGLSGFFFIPLFIFILTKMQIEPEEQVLKQKFGTNYLTYQQKVRRWI